jgi:hypothetical protein
MDGKAEQSVCVKFGAKLSKSATEALGVCRTFLKRGSGF